MRRATVYGVMLILFAALLMVSACGGGGQTTPVQTPPVNTTTNTPGVTTTTEPAAPGTTSPGAAAGKASALTFLTQPSGAKAGVPFKVQPVVAIVDGNGIVVTTYVGNTSLRIASGDGDLSGAATVIFIKGVATFTDLSFDKPGTYTLRAVTREIQSATSEPIIVEP